MNLVVFFLLSPAVTGEGQTHWRELPSPPTPAVRAGKAVFRQSCWGPGGPAVVASVVLASGSSDCSSWSSSYTNTQVPHCAAEGTEPSTFLVTSIRLRETAQHIIPRLPAFETDPPFSFFFTSFLAPSGRRSSPAQQHACSGLFLFFLNLWCLRHLSVSPKRF